MTSQQVAHSFGPNMPSRITGTAQLVLEPGEVAPSLPWYQPLVPFYPPSITSGDGTSTTASLFASTEPQSWERQPSQLDISFRQGDDVLIPLYMQDPENPNLDMSGWEWHSQIRVLPSYTRTLVNEFTTDTDYFPAGQYHATLGTTLVKLFLPRELNDHRGKYAWEMYSVGPYDFSEFPQPEDWPTDAEPWPPQTQLRTWLYGYCTILPRTTDTDVLPDSSGSSNTWPGDGDGWSPPWYSVGPNGRVP